MDFWDLTKVILRRWYVAVPMLILTGLAAAYTMTTVQPDYKATAYVQLIPPPEASITTNIKSLRNPWLDLGLGSLNTAATYATVDRKFLNQLKTDGMSDNVVIENGYPAPIATVEVIGTSKEQATNTANMVVDRFDDIVKSLQDDYAVQTPGRILTRRLDTGNNLEETGGKVKRALVAVGGAGVLMTAGLTVAFDAVLRRRKRRRDEPEEAQRDETPTGPSGGSAAVLPSPTSTPTPAPAPVPVSIPGERTVKIPAQSRAPGRVPAAPAVNGGAAPVVNGAKGGARVNGVGRKSGTPRAKGEGTIVVPGSVYRSGQKRE